MRASDKANQRTRDFEELTSEHDRIVQWIDDNAFELSLGACLTTLPRPSPDQFDALLSNFEVIQKTWEYPVVNRGYTLGFIDLRVHYSFQDWRLENRRSNYVNFEAKPSIKSCGEVIRQIRYYQSYFERNDVFAVVSPDASKYAEILAGQTILACTYRPDFVPKVPRPKECLKCSRRYFVICDCDEIADTGKEWE